KPAASHHGWAIIKHSVEPWDKGQTVAGVGRNPLRVGCTAARAPVRLGLVRSEEIIGPRAECWESHDRWNGKNSGGHCACRLATCTGEAGRDSQPGLSADEYGPVSVGVGRRAPVGRPERGRG